MLLFAIYTRRSRCDGSLSPSLSFSEVLLFVFVERAPHTYTHTLPLFYYFCVAVITVSESCRVEEPFQSFFSFHLCTKPWAHASFVCMHPHQCVLCRSPPRISCRPRRSNICMYTLSSQQRSNDSLPWCSEKVRFNKPPFLCLSQYCFRKRAT